LKNKHYKAKGSVTSTRFDMPTHRWCTHFLISVLGICNYFGLLDSKDKLINWQTTHNTQQQW